MLSLAPRKLDVQHYTLDTKSSEPTFLHMNRENESKHNTKHLWNKLSTIHILAHLSACTIRKINTILSNVFITTSNILKTRTLHVLQILAQPL